MAHKGALLKPLPLVNPSNLRASALCHSGPFRSVPARSCPFPSSPCASTRPYGTTPSQPVRPGPLLNPPPQTRPLRNCRFRACSSCRQPCLHSCAPWIPAFAGMTEWVIQVSRRRGRRPGRPIRTLSREARGRLCRHSGPVPEFTGEVGDERGACGGRTGSTASAVSDEELLVLSGPQAARAQLDALTLALHDDDRSLHVGEEPPVRVAVRVAHVLAGPPPLVAYLAHRHRTTYIANTLANAFADTKILADPRRAQYNAATAAVGAV